MRVMESNHRGRSGGLVSLFWVFLLCFQGVHPAAAGPNLETRARVKEDFVTTYPVPPQERTFPAGTELDYHGSLGDALLAGDTTAPDGQRIIALPRERDGRTMARVVDGRVRVEADLETLVDQGYHVFRAGAVFAVSARDGGDLLITTGDPGEGGTVRVPAGRFTVERVLASGTESSGNRQEELETAYAAALEAHLSAHPPATELEEVTTAGDAVCLITNGDGAGTGFLLVMEGRVYCLTNHHVLGEARELKIKTSDGRSFTPLFYEVARDRDLARVLIKESPPAFMTMNKAEYGDKVSVVGNRGGMGVVRAERAEVIGFAPGIIELDSEFARGNSGSPVIRDDGSVVGVATFLISTREEQLGKEDIKEGEMLFEDRYFATPLDADIEWVPASSSLLSRLHRSVREDDIFTGDAFSLLRMIARSPYTPIPDNLSASAELRQWADRHNQMLGRSRQAVLNPGRQFVSQQDYEAWQQERAFELLDGMQAILRRLEHLSRTRLTRLRSRLPSYPEIGYYPSITKELVRRYELLVELTNVVADLLKETARRPQTS